MRHPGQEWSCGKCHQFKHLCPGLAIARDCTAERVLLSTHMAAHWNRIGFRPDTEASSEVDDLPEVDIQVGQVRKERPAIPDNRLCSKYRSVILKGFLPATPIEEILKEIPENCLPSEHLSDCVSRNEKTGAITLSNLESDQCLIIMESMHTKKFLGRKVFVTSVVPRSPEKTSSTEAAAESTVLSPKPSSETGNPVSSEPKSSDLVPSLSSPVLDPKASFLGASKSGSGQSIFLIKNGVEDFEFSSPLKAFGQNGNNKDKSLKDMFELPNKRKASISPESKETTRKEKKAAKKELKNKSKNEIRAKQQLEVSPLKV